jgi:glutaminyl-tRNA synthetase
VGLTSLPPLAVSLVEERNPKFATMSSNEGDSPATDFIRQIVKADTESGRYEGRVVTRFPPEPNGYLHVGHVKAISVNFGIAEDFGGRYHLRFDDTNPASEDEEFVLSIQDDIRWLGFDWGEHLYFASDYFGQLYDFAEVLIQNELAYVDSQSGQDIREGRGTVTEPGVDSPYRTRSAEQNLDLFRGMRAGEFEDGAHVLRGKIDMASTNMLMRDPVLYRIRHAHHYRQGDTWCIYPLYDFAHCLEDAIEGITHSLCSIEFTNNRDLYDWVLESAGFEEPRPHQYEFARLKIENAVLSKRSIIPLVEAGIVSGWDDPRLSTVRGFRRRGVPPEALRNFVNMVGIARTESTIDVARLDFAIREVLNDIAPRVMAVLNPLRIVLTNYAEGAGEVLEAPYYPHDVPLEGSRGVPFSRELYIERADFEEDPPKGFRRLVPGGEIRLRYAYVIRCEEVVKDSEGTIVELRCSYDPETRGGGTPDGRKVKGTVQWVSAEHGLDAEVRLYNRLFLDEALDKGGEEPVDLLALVSPESIRVIDGAKIEPSVKNDPIDTRYQFERTGYFWRDPVDGVDERLVFNRIVSLKDSWGKKTTPAPRLRVSEKSVASPTAQGSSHPPTRRADSESGSSAPGERPAVSEQRAAVRAADSVLTGRFERYATELGLSTEHADQLSASHATGNFFEAALETHNEPSEVAAWTVTDLRGVWGDRSLEKLPFGGEALGSLAALVASGRVSRRAAKDVLLRMVEQGGDPASLVAEMGLEKLDDRAALQSAIDAVLAAWPEKVEEYLRGKHTLIGLFIGEVMKATRGAADPKAVRELLTESLER